MREQLQHSLGPSFETRLSGSSRTTRALSLLQRGRWLCAAALATAALSFVATRSLERVQRTNQVEAPRHAPQPRATHMQLPARLELESQQLSAASKSAAPATGGGNRTAAGSRRSNIAAASSNAPATAAPPGLAAELQGLAEIRRLLHSSPSRALAAAEAQQQRFAQGALGPERELLRIEALLNAGRAEEAKRRASRALHASDNPPYRERIEKLFAQTRVLAADGAGKQATRAQRD
jgi:hypothetical protein